MVIHVKNRDGRVLPVASATRSFALRERGLAATSSSSSFVVRAFRKDGEIWVLAVNSTREPVTGAVEVEGHGRIALSLPPLGVEFKVLYGRRSPSAPCG